MVVYGGRIVAERYAEGFNAAMPLIGWSMSKSAVNALVGLRVKDGKLALNDTALMPQWQGEDDPRRAITLDQLMRMTSGLAFDETYGGTQSDVVQMLFVKGDKAAFAADQPLAYPPGTHWAYSSGTTTIISAILRRSFANEHDYLGYPLERLFGPLGMRSAVLEPDASGTFAASSFLYASARDFARLGLLFMRDGVWEGTRLLPEGWVAYSRKPTALSPRGEYGAHVWLKLPESSSKRQAEDADRRLLHARSRPADPRRRAVTRSRHRQARPDAGGRRLGQHARACADRRRLSGARAIKSDPAASAEARTAGPESSMPTEPAARPAAWRAASQPELRGRRPEELPPPSSRRCSYWPTGRQARSRQSLSR